MGQTALFGTGDLHCESCGSVSTSERIHRMTHYVTDSLREQGLCGAQSHILSQILGAERGTFVDISTPEKRRRLRDRAHALRLTDEQIRRYLDRPS